MTTLDVASRSVERLLPLLHTQLCTPPPPRATSALATSDDAWLSSSLARWRRCFHIWRKLIGSDVVFLVLLFYAGCLWSPDYDALADFIAREEEAFEDGESTDIVQGLRQREPSVWALEALHFMRLFEIYEVSSDARTARPKTSEGAVANEEEDEEEALGDADDTGESRRGEPRDGRSMGIADGTSAPTSSQPLPVGHSTIVLEQLAARVVAVAVSEGDPITLPKKSGSTAASATSSSTSGLNASHPPSTGAVEREEVLRQLLVSVADRDEVVVQQVATDLVSRWFALTEAAANKDSAAARAHRDYYMASAIKFAAYVDGALSALYEENAHIAAVLARQSIPPGPLQHLLQTAVPSIACCLVIEEAAAMRGEFNGSDDAGCAHPQVDDVIPLCLPPQAMLLPSHLLGRGSSVSVWLPACTAPRGGMREPDGRQLPVSDGDASLSAARVGHTSTEIPRARGQFVSCDVCSHSVQWHATTGPTTSASAAAAAPTLSQPSISPMALSLRFRPETWLTTSTTTGYGAHGASRDVSYASVTAVFPPRVATTTAAPPHSPRTPSSPTSPVASAARGAFVANWVCDGRALAHSYVRVDALVPRLVFAASLPLAASASAGTTSTNTPASTASAATSYLSIVDKLVARAVEHAKSRDTTDPAHTSLASPAASRKRSRSGGVQNKGSGSHHAHSVAHPLLSTETSVATLVSFSGLSASHAVSWWSGLIRAHHNTSARLGRMPSAASASIKRRGAADQDEDDEKDKREDDEEQEGSLTSSRGRGGVGRGRTSAYRGRGGGGRGDGRRRASTLSAKSGASDSPTGSFAAGGVDEGADVAQSSRTLVWLLQHHFHYNHVYMATTRTTSTALRAGMSRDAIAVVAQFTHLTGRRVLALRSLVPEACATAPTHAPAPNPALATGMGKAGHVRRGLNEPTHTAVRASPHGAAEAAQIEASHAGTNAHGGRGANAPPASLLDTRSTPTDSRTEVVVTAASALSLAALVLAHSVVEKDLLAQNAMILWTTELASTLVDLALLHRCRPHAYLLRAAGIGVCILPQRPQSLLVMVGLVAAVSARQRQTMRQAPTHTTTNTSALRGRQHGAIASSSWWRVFDETVLQDPVMPGLFFPGTWRLLESATSTLKETAQKLLKREARRRVASLRGAAITTTATEVRTDLSEEDPGTAATEAVEETHAPVQSSDVHVPARPEVRLGAASENGVGVERRRWALSCAHGGVLELDALGCARVGGPAEDGGPLLLHASTDRAQPGHAARRTGERVSTTLALWCSPEARLPDMTTHAPSSPSRLSAVQNNPGTPVLDVQVESGVRSCAHVWASAVAQPVPGLTPLAQRLARSKTPPRRGTRLRLGGESRMEAPPLLARVEEEEGTGPRGVCDGHVNGAQPHLARQLQWLWLSTENAVMASRQYDDARDMNTPCASLTP